MRPFDAMKHSATTGYSVRREVVRVLDLALAARRKHPVRFCRPSPPLKQIEPQQGRNLPNVSKGTAPSRTEAATDAGLSERQRKTAFKPTASQTALRLVIGNRRSCFPHISAELMFCRPGHPQTVQPSFLDTAGVPQLRWIVTNVSNRGRHPTLATRLWNPK